MTPRQQYCLAHPATDAYQATAPVYANHEGLAWTFLAVTFEAEPGDSEPHPYWHAAVAAFRRPAGPIPVTRWTHEMRLGAAKLLEALTAGVGAGYGSVEFAETSLHIRVPLTPEEREAVRRAMTRSDQAAIGH